MFLLPLRAIIPNLLSEKVGLVFLVSFSLLSCTPKEIQTEPELAPKVIAVYPTSDTLPENLLRFYIQFSKPMKIVDNLEHIKLCNAVGEEVKGAIFNNVYELWDREQKQLTIILDPARVKTGLTAHKSMGRALKQGEQFQLIIENAEDIFGNGLQQRFIKSFFVSKADLQSPNLDHWQVNAPLSNTKTPLTISFPQALDQISLFNRIYVADKNKDFVSGRIELSDKEKKWQFFPSKQWEEGLYTLHVNSRLEDPSGNNLNGLFDHQIGSLNYLKEGQIIKLKIEVKEK